MNNLVRYVSFEIDSNGYIWHWCEPVYIYNGDEMTMGNFILEGYFIPLSEVPEEFITDDGWCDLSEAKYDVNTGKIEYSPERVEENLIINIKAQREEEFSKFDKYQLPYLQETLTEEQKNQYNQWRQAWLDAPETKIIPERPEWFEET